MRLDCSVNRNLSVDRLEKSWLNNLRRNFLIPGTHGHIRSGDFACIWNQHWLALLFFFSSVFVLATVYFEFSKGTQARMAMIRETAPAAFYHLVQRNSRRYGGFIIHTGMAILMIGIAASSFFSLEKDAMVHKINHFRREVIN